MKKNGRKKGNIRLALSFQDIQVLMTMSINMNKLRR